MTIIVDHQQRQTTILERGFELFAAEGFGGVTYQKIADRCGISRTSIYKYFKSKDEIFTFAIKLSTGKLTTMIEKVLERRDWSPSEKISRIMHITTRMLSENRIFLTVVLDYILTQKHAGADVRRRVRRHTGGMKHLLSRLLREATDAREMNVPHSEIAAAHLFGQLESFVLNLTVTDTLDVKDCLELIDAYLDGLKNRPRPLTFDDNTG